MTDTKKRDYRVEGSIYYHAMTGYGRPFIIQKIHEDGSCDLHNLDDGGNVTLTKEQMDDFEIK